MNIPETEKNILEFWKKNKIFKKSLEKKSPKGDFVFYEGPPTANGKPGLHHVLSRSFKDLISRLKTMQGYHVERKAGWDTHGLPVELEVEKKLRLKDKKEVEKYGIEKFNKQCKNSVWKYKEEWEKMTERIGFWIDLENPYITYSNEYIESLWWIIKQAHKKGLLYIMKLLRDTDALKKNPCILNLKLKIMNIFLLGQLLHGLCLEMLPWLLVKKLNMLKLNKIMKS